MKVIHALPLLIMLVTGCGPGMTDGAYPIKDGYLLYDTGTNGKTIEYKDKKGVMNNVVRERADSYIVDGNKIIVARRPAEIVMRGGIADWKVSPTCEYWMINTETHAVEQIADASKWSTVRCN